MALFSRSDPSVAAPSAPKHHTAVDGLAAATATAVAVLGAMQLAAPVFAAPLTGLEASTGAEIIAVQWLALAALLMIGAVTRLRVVTIFSAEFLMIGAIAACAIMFFRTSQSMAVLVHGGIAVMAFACSGLARLFDKAELKRELRFAREQAKPVPAPDLAGKATWDEGREIQRDY